MRWKGPFLYRDKPVRWGTKKTEYGTLYAFEDPLNKGEEEQSLLMKVESNTISMAEFEQKCKLVGVFCLISDMTKDVFDMFDLYKGREDVELVFDAMKNELESDKTYLRSDETVRGYFLVTFLAMRIYFKILKRLREKELTTHLRQIKIKSLPVNHLFFLSLFHIKESIGVSSLTKNERSSTCEKLFRGGRRRN